MTAPHIAGKAPLPVDVKAGETYYWCACGQSKSQPFCDGSHKGSDFSPLAWTADADKKAFFCACKHSKNSPLCDGSHKAV